MIIPDERLNHNQRGLVEMAFRNCGDDAIIFLPPSPCELGQRKESAHDGGYQFLQGILNDYRYAR